MENLLVTSYLLKPKCEKGFFLIKKYTYCYFISCLCKIFFRKENTYFSKHSEMLNILNSYIENMYASKRFYEITTYNKINNLKTSKCFSFLTLYCNY